MLKHMKNAVFLRNFLMLFTFLGLCVAGVGYYIFKSSRELSFTDNWVIQTQESILESQELITAIQGMVASQRGYLLSGDQKFLNLFEAGKNKASQQLASLSNRMRDNPAQQTRLLELQQGVYKLTEALTSAIQKVEKGQLKTADLTPVELQSEERDNILRIAGNILNEEYALLALRADLLQKRTREYHYTLFIGTALSALMLLVFNTFLLTARAQRSRAEEFLRIAEDRLQLAIRGANDGIFDWDLVTNNLYWSPHFKSMLGYDDDEITASIDVFNGLIHRDDLTALWAAYHEYIKGDMAEFSHIFRVRHKSGRWIWLNMRGKAMADNDGKPVRFSGVHTDVTHIKEYEIQLEIAKENAERANEAKGEFLAHMSHEIRTPLTAISGIVEIFGQNIDAFDDKYKKLVRTLGSSAASLKDLITDILDFSKIESREIDMANENFLLDDLFAQVISITSVKAHEKKLDFRFDYELVSGTYFNGDRARLRQVLINLIGNAIKFTDRGFVRVNADIETLDEGHLLIIKVVDSGIGIASTSQEIIFEKFRQADSSVSRRYGGTGLGLPISKNLIELMGGKITVESALGTGSTFTVHLPMKERITDEARSHGNDIRIQKLNDKLKHAVDGQRRVLLVEDYEGNVVVLGHILDTMDMTHDVARTGVEAIDLWKERHYDLVLMDVQMPEMDGLTATRNIRRLEIEQTMERTPIVGLTAHALVADKEKCIEAGMDDYLSKPIDEVALKEAILRHVKKKQPGGESRAA